MSRNRVNNWVWDLFCPALNMNNPPRLQYSAPIILGAQRYQSTTVLKYQLADADYDDSSRDSSHVKYT